MVPDPAGLSVSLPMRPRSRRCGTLGRSGRRGCRNRPKRCGGDCAGSPHGGVRGACGGAGRTSAARRRSSKVRGVVAPTRLGTGQAGANERRLAEAILRPRARRARHADARVAGVARGRAPGNQDVLDRIQGHRLVVSDALSREGANTSERRGDGMKRHRKRKRGGSRRGQSSKGRANARGHVVPPCPECRPLPQRPAGAAWVILRVMPGEGGEHDIGRSRRERRQRRGAHRRKQSPCGRAGACRRSA